MLTFGSPAAMTDTYRVYFEINQDGVPTAHFDDSGQSQAVAESLDFMGENRTITARLVECDASLQVEFRTPDGALGTVFRLANPASYFRCLAHEASEQGYTLNKRDFSILETKLEREQTWTAPFDLPCQLHQSIYASSQLSLTKIQQLSDRGLRRHIH